MSKNPKIKKLWEREHVKTTARSRTSCPYCKKIVTGIGRMVCRHLVLTIQLADNIYKWKFSTPGTTKNKKREVKITRPDPKPVMRMSLQPYVVTGKSSASGSGQKQPQQKNDKRKMLKDWVKNLK